MTQIIPALDLLDHKIVRLKQGKYDEVTYYPYQLEEKIAQYIEQGASRIHLVDLDGAKNPARNQHEFIGSVIKNFPGVQFQCGGGFRNLEMIKTGLEHGLSQTVISSFPIKNEAEFIEAVKYFGSEKFIIAADCIREISPTHLNQPILEQFQVRISGWLESAQMSLKAMINKMLELGIKDFLVTDIAKDGMNQGPNVELYQNILQEFSIINLIASGGIRSEEDIATLNTVNVPYCVVGKALLEEKIKLK